jgi:glycerate-2-kinase
LSDVPGDPLEVIASGPTVPDSTTYEQALKVLSTHGLSEIIPDKIFHLLLDGVKGLKPETPKQGDTIFNKTFNLLIGSNRMALEACHNKALEFNINAVIMDNQLQGDVTSVAEYIVETAIRFKNDKNEVKPVCLLFGGETTVKMTGKGTGGRNQHFALLSALLLQSNPGITILSAGTDGNDGPTDAAGAVVDSATIQKATLKNLDPETYLTGFDSYNFFKNTGELVTTGPTMTNVMDIIVVIIE